MVVLMIATGWVIISANLFSCYTTVHIWYFVYSVIYIEVKLYTPFILNVSSWIKATVLVLPNWEKYVLVVSPKLFLWISIFSTESTIKVFLPTYTVKYIIFQSPSVLIIWSGFSSWPSILHSFQINKKNTAFKNYLSF